MSQATPSPNVISAGDRTALYNLLAQKGELDGKRYDVDPESGLSAEVLEAYLSDDRYTLNSYLGEFEGQLESSSYGIATDPSQSPFTSVPKLRIEIGSKIPDPTSLTSQQQAINNALLNIYCGQRLLAALPLKRVAQKKTLEFPIDLEASGFKPSRPADYVIQLDIQKRDPKMLQALRALDADPIETDDLHMTVIANLATTGMDPSSGLAKEMRARRHGVGEPNKLHQEVVHEYTFVRTDPDPSVGGLPKLVRDVSLLSHRIHSLTGNKGLQQVPMRHHGMSPVNKALGFGG